MSFSTPPSSYCFKYPSCLNFTLSNFPLAAEETGTGNWRLHKGHKVGWDLHQGLFTESAVVRWFSSVTSNSSTNLRKMERGISNYSLYATSVSATWTRSSMRRQCETTRRFTRRRRQKVRPDPEGLFSLCFAVFLTSCLFCDLEHKQLLKNAQLELKKSKRKDYYKVLGVDKNATEEEIKKAYRKRALLHHPGCQSSSSPF